jgi:hypothetical protein
MDQLVEWLPSNCEALSSNLRKEGTEVGRKKGREKKDITGNPNHNFWGIIIFLETCDNFHNFPQPTQRPTLV